MNIVSKDPNLHYEILEMAESLYKFMQDKYKFTCEPKIFFRSDVENAKNILGRTGYYDASNEEVHIFITNRHPKDILRSLAHELLHHIQGCEGMVKAERGDVDGTSNPNYFIHDKFLKKIELDAFKRGNEAMREWEALVKQGDIKVEKKDLEEKKKKTKIPKKKLSRYKTMVKDIADKIKKSNPDIPDSIKFGTAANKAKEKLKIHTEETMKESKQPEQKEVEVNEALKNSLYYVEEDRPLSQAYNIRDEKIYNELLKKFKIKK